MNEPSTQQSAISLQTWSRGNLEFVSSCPACGQSDKIATEYERGDEFGRMPDIWHMAHCRYCKSLYLNPRPDRSSLPLAYADYYTHHPNNSEQPEGGGFVTALVNGYLNHRFGMNRQPVLSIGALLFTLIEPLRLKLDIYGRHLKRPTSGVSSTLLDIGCGNGAFLSRAREMGWTVQGCEPDKNAVQVCREQDLKVLLGDAFHPELDNQKFNAITMNHVIEHVYEPEHLLHRAFELLEPGGTLWMALPNPAAVGLSVFKQGWVNLHMPFHLIIPSQKTLLDWINSTGFVDAKFVRRGIQSSGLWNETRRISQRENTYRSTLHFNLGRIIGDILSTFSPRWGEETVIIAQKPICRLSLHEVK
jgi:2-polyprenyl-3-methyl-5-hydroxy-6-metoxy-1,4-benzoquinol methylase